MLGLPTAGRSPYRFLSVPDSRTSICFLVGSPVAATDHLPIALEARFEAECLPYLGDIYKSAARVLGDSSRAEDVCQEVFLQAWKSFGRYQSGTNAKAWLYKILFHCVNHHRRKWFRFPVLKETEEFLEENLVAPATVPEQLNDEDILGALERIPADFKAVVLLVDVEEFSYREAAGILGVPIGTVMSRLSRGRRALKEHLAAVASSYGLAAEGSQT